MAEGGDVACGTTSLLSFRCDMLSCEELNTGKCEECGRAGCKPSGEVCCDVLVSICERVDVGLVREELLMAEAGVTVSGTEVTTYCLGVLRANEASGERARGREPPSRIGDAWGEPLMVVVILGSC